MKRARTRGFIRDAVNRQHISCRCFRDHFSHHVFLIMSQAVELKTPAHFSEALRQTGDMLIVVYFYATWCGPCRVFGPRFDELASSSTTSSARFYKVDVDKNAESADKYNVTAMPTVILFKDNGKVGKACCLLLCVDDDSDWYAINHEQQLTHYPTLSLRRSSGMTS